MIKEKFGKIEYNFFYPLFFTIIFILILIQYSFDSFDSIFYDLWTRFDINLNNSDPVVMVTLDEESDEFLGENYPYTYASHVRMIKKVLKDKPHVINYFVSLDDPASSIEKKYFIDFKSSIKDFVADSGHFRFATQMDAWGEALPSKDLQFLGYSLGIINIDSQVFAKDDVSRRALLNISGDDSIHLWTAKIFRNIIGSYPKEANSYKGSYYNSEADASFGLFKYSDNPLISKGKVKSIPFHRVVVGYYPKDFFKNKIVLIGPQYVSNSSDFVFTPFSKSKEKAPKLAVHSQIIKSLIYDKTILKLPDLVSDILSILFAVILSVLISRVKPTKGLVITVGLMLLSFVLSYSMFTFFSTWLKLSHIILSIFVVYYIWVPYRAIREYQHRYVIEEESKLLKQVDKLKQNFISLMSHDLKTPVAKIAGITDILKNQFSNDNEQMGYLNEIQKSTKELNNFITSILDLTKVESQRLDLNFASKDVNKIIEEIVTKLRYEAEQNKIKLRTQLDPLYPINIDVVLIKRVVSNLVENAIKYSGSDSEVSIKTWDDEKWVYIEIKDTGVGIEPDDLEHIFDKFYRVKNDKSHSVKGSGLGLYLVKYFIELHEGNIRAESEVGSGTTFTITLKNE
jgi:signal transduction histidine kinase